MKHKEGQRKKNNVRDINARDAVTGYYGNGEDRERDTQHRQTETGGERGREASKAAVDEKKNRTPTSGGVHAPKKQDNQRYRVTRSM